MSWTITGSEKNITDPYRSNVSLLLRGDLVTTSTNIVDSSPSPKTVTAVDNAQISTAIADPFGNSSKGVLAFDGTGDYLRIAPVNSLALNNGAFTAETWFYANSLAGDEKTLFHKWGGTASLNGYRLNISAAGGLIWYTQTTARITSSLVSTLTWYHVAICGNGSTSTMYLNGSIVNGIPAADVFSDTPTQEFQVASLNLTGYIFPFNGYIDNLRITKGVARYETGTGANAGKMVFAGTNTLALPTAPFPDI